MMLGLASVFSGSLSAGIISGTFDLNGSLTATLNTIAWSDGVTPQEATVENDSDLSASFLGFGNSLVSIADLNFNGPPPEPVGLLFAGQPFITFLSPLASSFPSLMINYIAPGEGGSAGCAAPAAGGQTCTPTVPGGSAFEFSNTATVIGGKPVITSSMTFDFSGLTSDGLGAWSGAFTAQFNEPFQDVINSLTAGSVTRAYTGSGLVITLAAPGVPEPSGLVLMGVGLLLLAAGRVHFRRKQRPVSGPVS